MTTTKRPIRFSLPDVYAENAKNLDGDKERIDTIQLITFDASIPAPKNNRDRREYDPRFSTVVEGPLLDGPIQAFLHGLRFGLDSHARRRILVWLWFGRRVRVLQAISGDRRRTDLSGIRCQGMPQDPRRWDVRR